MCRGIAHPRWSSLLPDSVRSALPAIIDFGSWMVRAVGGLGSAAILTVAIGCNSGEIDQLRSQLAQAQTDLAAAQSQLAASQQQSQSLLSQLTDSQAAQATAQNQLAQANATMATVQAQMADSKNALAAAQGQLADSTANSQSLERQLQDAQSAARAMETELADTKSTLATVKATLDKLTLPTPVAVRSDQQSGRVARGSIAIPIQVDALNEVRGQVYCQSADGGCKHALIQDPAGNTVLDFGVLNQITNFRFVAGEGGTFSVILVSRLLSGFQYSVSFTVYKSYESPGS